MTLRKCCLDVQWLAHSKLYTDRLSCTLQSAAVCLHSSSEKDKATHPAHISSAAAAAAVTSARLSLISCLCIVINLLRIMRRAVRWLAAIMIARYLSANYDDSHYVGLRIRRTFQLITGRRSSRSPSFYCLSPLRCFDSETCWENLDTLNFQFVCSGNFQGHDVRWTWT